jgi:hypothetical protein
MKRIRGKTAAKTLAPRFLTPRLSANFFEVGLSANFVYTAMQRNGPWFCAVAVLISAMIAADPGGYCSNVNK